MKNPFSSILSACKQTFSDLLRPSTINSQPSTLTKSFASAWLRGRDDTMGPMLLTSPYQQSTWVYSCVSTVAETVSAIPFRILKGAEQKESVLASGDAVSLFQRPHPQMDRFQFWELVLSWLVLRGEAFIVGLDHHERLAARNHRPRHLLVLEPDGFQEIVSNHCLLGWRYSGFGSRAPLPAQVFLPEEVIHIKLPHPFDFWRGISPLTVAHLAAQTDYAASQFMKGVMLNNADTGLIVTTTDQLSPEQVEEIKATIRERKRSVGTADRPLFLWGGTRVEKPTISTTDLQFLENRKFNRQEICSIFKVPQELLGYTEDANRSVSDSARLNFFENRIIPLCRRLEAALDPIVKRFGNDLRGEFHVKGTPIMQAAQRARYDTVQKMFNVGIPVNVINENLDLGLPDLPHGQKSYLPTNLHEVGELPLPLNSHRLDGRSHECDRLLALLAAYKAELRKRNSLPSPPPGFPPPYNQHGLSH